MADKLLAQGEATLTARSAGNRDAGSPRGGLILVGDIYEAGMLYADANGLPMDSARVQRATVVAAVHLNRNVASPCSAPIVVNRIATLTQKDRPAVIAGWIEKGLGKWADKTKVPAWLRTAGVQFPSTAAMRALGKRTAEVDRQQTRMARRDDGAEARRLSR